MDACESPNSRRRLLALGTVIGLLVAAVITCAAAAPVAKTYSFFTTSDVSSVPTDPDATPIEVGMRFATTRAGTVSAVRVLRAHGYTAPVPVRIWSPDGDQLVSVNSAAGTGGAWHQVDLPEPLPINPGEYVVSYHTTRYRVSENFFEAPLRSGPLSTANAAGVYAYGPGGFPVSNWRASNYWVDVVFLPAPEQPPPPPGPTTPTPTGPLPLRPLPSEGGPGYYAAYPNTVVAGWTAPSFFPIAVWAESVIGPNDTALDQDVGLNTYLSPTGNSNLALIRAAGMHLIASTPDQVDPATVGWFLADEVDMWGGAGSAAWTGNWPGTGPICDPAGSLCGYTIQQTLLTDLPNDGRLRAGNYGKGVIFWQSDAEAARFVNSYTSLVSADVYWYTDPNVCESSSEGPAFGVTPENCRRAANYGRIIDRMRALDARDGRRQPIFAFVEVGHPFTDDSAPTITANQIAGAVMSSLIHGARGIIYFNHNFGGPCISQHVLRDACGAAVRPKVAETNRRISALARVLNTPSYGWRFNADLDTMLKIHGGAYYVFAMPGPTAGTGRQRLTLPPGLAGAPAEVLFEGRTVPTAGGVIVDNFAQEHSYHIYKITP